MVDSIAYIGDILSFYLDYQANESFLDTAIEFENILKHARQFGYKMKTSALAFGELSLYVMVPANVNGQGPDIRYVPILRRGSQFL